ncbi:hypothetical protein GLAREA_09340 [Glarea lozoyensis ATCC 20868]|uniref:Uncharacterized protein n=1 Tax=Glarea lozoyensis (strain ATCC 20868 / MF5171) TaxID=1116229 RepID=S3CRC7_GLAL2|nr:uncharacterized protein GLAREA_09340 [Glarea lozoyensis ATCC 20868]EPE28220.1 hypothetical protein GLAREA_09340 [Glarea lozoyensis ATCC 20868]
MDPRAMRVLWRELPAAWEIQRTITATDRVLFSSRAQFQKIHDISTVNEYVKEEEERWLFNKEKFAWAIKRGGRRFVEPDENPTAVRSVVGFWLFPAEALGAMAGDLSRTKKTFNLSGYWPELALSCLD